MKSFLTKITSGVAAAGLFLVACVMAGLGLSLVVFLAMFGLAVIGLSILTAPLLTFVQTPERTDAETVAA